MLLDKLERFTCDKSFYNQLASLYLSDADTAMQQLFHFREVDGSPFTTFESGPLILFLIPYFFVAAVTSGVLAPAGLFVPTLLAGATFGRLVGHMLNSVAPGSVTDSGTYALIGAAAMLGGMSRMTIAGTVILLEACNKNEYLLPLMLTFAAARYSGNAINQVGRLCLCLCLCSCLCLAAIRFNPLRLVLTPLTLLTPPSPIVPLRSTQRSAHVRPSN